MTEPHPDWQGRHRWELALPGQAEADAALAQRVIATIEADPALAARLHQASDVDSSRLALHHTLGTAPLSSAAGDHNHQLEDLLHPTRVWMAQAQTAPPGIVLATAETKDNQFIDRLGRGTGGDISCDFRVGHWYEFTYRARFQCSGVPAAADARIRFAQGRAVVNTDLQVAGRSVSIQTTGGGGAVSFDCVALLDENAMIQSADVRVGAFYDLTAGGGGGTLSVDQPAGAWRQLIVREYLQDPAINL